MGGTLDQVRARTRLARGRCPTAATYRPHLKFICSCSKELGQWDLLMEFGKAKGHSNPFLGKRLACHVAERASGPHGRCEPSAFVEPRPHDMF